MTDWTSQDLIHKLADALVGDLPELLDTVRVQLAEESPDYAMFLVAERQEVAQAAEITVRRLVAGADEHAATAVELAPVQAALFEAIGRLQFREGHDLTRLLSAYHIGARAAWRHISTTAVDLGLPAAMIAELAETLFSFIDQLSSASVRGYVREQSEAAAERERLREELAVLLLSDRCDAASLAAAAERARWPLPVSVAVILIDPGDEVSRFVVARIDSGILMVRWHDWIAAICPEPKPLPRERLIGLLHGARAVIAPPVALDQVPASARIAAAAAALRRDGLLAEDVVFVEDHLDAVIVHRDPRSLEALRTRVLAPLDAVPAAARDRLTETLAAWLRHMGDRRAVAADLHVHPQTVRYRMTRLRDLFGEALDDPEARIRLTLALAWGPPASSQP